MNEKEYVKEIENLLIFMCQSYEEMQTEVFKRHPDLRVSIPQIQGFSLNMSISKLSKMEVASPLFSNKELVEKLELNRSLRL